MSDAFVDKIFQYIGQGTAVAVAGWGVWKFIHSRTIYPKASVTHSVWHDSIAKGMTVVHVAAKFENKGNNLISLKSGFCRIQQVRPAPNEIQEVIDGGEDPTSKEGNDREIPWKMIKKHEWEFEDIEIEPGEVEGIHCDFLIPESVKGVMVYTYFKNASKRKEIGWSETTFIDLEKEMK